MQRSLQRISPIAPALVSATEVPVLPDPVTIQEILDMNMEKLTTGPGQRQGVSFQTTSSWSCLEDSALPTGHCPLGGADCVGKGHESSELELEMDKFMASLTATKLPNTVIRTITAAKDLQKFTKRSHQPEVATGQTLAACSTSLLGVGAAFS